MSDKIRWGVLSTANIGKKAVIPAIQQSHNGEVVAVASRSQERARAFADELGIEHAYGSYQDLIDSGTVDAVYNPLPNDDHVPWSVKCAQAGLAVLCEKPLGMDADNAQQAVDAFAQKDILLAEAFMYRFHPRYQIVRDLIDSGEIGDLQVINATFTFSIGDGDNIRLHKQHGGGGLMDVGCYCISAMRLVTGEEPVTGQAYARYHPQTDVDMRAAAILSFPSGVLGHFDCGMDTHRTNMLDIRGTQGRIRLDDAFIAGPEDALPVHIWRGTNAPQHEEIPVGAANQYTLMAEEFADALQTGRQFRYPIADAVANMRVIDMLRHSARQHAST